jgi:Holliday junction resolvasome RuvABC endonuclease subunit
MGLISAMNTKPAHTVMGIDASTNSLAFAVITDGELVKYGKINFTGTTSYERLKDCHQKVSSIAEMFQIDYIAIEKVIKVNSADTAIKLGMVVGVILSVLLENAKDVHEVAPISWQSFIGNYIYTKARKEEVKREHPDKSDTWIKAYIRLRRKEYTIDYFQKEFGIANTDNDVADAIGLAWYASHHLTR